jgi:hypothetical protein
VGRYIVHTPDGPRCKVIYGRRYKDVEKKLAEARGDAGNTTLGEHLGAVAGR